MLEFGYSCKVICMYSLIALRNWISNSVLSERRRQTLWAFVLISSQITYKVRLLKTLLHYLSFSGSNKKWGRWLLVDTYGHSWTHYYAYAARLVKSSYFSQINVSLLKISRRYVHWWKCYEKKILFVFRKDTLGLYVKIVNQVSSVNTVPIDVFYPTPHLQISPWSSSLYAWKDIKIVFKY